jgi:hypothetical protein
MARTREQIQTEIIDEIQTYPQLNDLDAGGNPSNTADWFTWTNIFSTIINALEQLWDVFSSDIDNKILTSRVGNARWLQDKVFKFQYDANNPQVPIVTDTFSVEYPIINESLQIVKACAVQQQPNRQVFVKVAKEVSNVLNPLDALEANALESYLREVQFAGTQVVLIRDPLTNGTLDADQVYIEGEVFYNGQFVLSQVQTNVETAINDYFKTLDFDGIVFRQELERVILNVDGVNDLVLSEIIGRTNNEPITGNNVEVVYRNKDGETPINGRQYQTAAGYTITEQTPTFTLAESLNYTIS